MSLFSVPDNIYRKIHSEQVSLIYKRYILLGSILGVLFFGSGYIFIKNTNAQAQTANQTRLIAQAQTTAQTPAQIIGQSTPSGQVLGASTAAVDELKRKIEEQTKNIEALN